MRPDFETVLEKLDLRGTLAAFRPVVIGTPPLGIATEDSDIDIACTAADLQAYANFVERRLGHLDGFSVEHFEVRAEPTVLVSFYFSGWEIELFCQAVGTEHQWGVRHFHIEQRLLALAPDLRDKVRRLKQQGIKTEPAFAAVLGLPGNPYQAILDLESKSDDALRNLVERSLT